MSRATSSPIDIFVTRRLPKRGLEVLRRAEVAWTVGQTRKSRGLSRAKLLAGVADSRALLSLLTDKVDRKVLSHANLLGVANMAVGFDNVDLEAATELGVPVSNTPGVLTETTADLTWALILAAARQLPQAHEFVVSGKYKIWDPNLFLGTDVGRGGSGARKVLGIIGYGRIGQAVARRAVGFNMKVLAYDPGNRLRVEASKFAHWAELDEVLESSDVLTLHPPLNDETRHLIGAPELQRMKSTAFVINTSRGPIVDEQALVEGLREGWIAGAGLDVYEREPKLTYGLTDLPNVVLLPHIGSASLDTRSRMAEMAATNALAHLHREEAPNVVNPEVYETEAYLRRVAR
jgi:glyoxylate reductase